MKLRKDRLSWVIAGISGCVFALWNLWIVYSWFDLLGHVTILKTLLVVGGLCFFCVCSFVYSLFDGKDEKYLRLLGAVFLLGILFWLFFASRGMGDGALHYRWQSMHCAAGLLVALLSSCYFLKHCIIRVSIAITVFIILCLAMQLQTGRRPHRLTYDHDAYYFLNFCRYYQNDAINYYDFIVNQNQCFNENCDISFELGKYLTEHIYNDWSIFYKENQRGIFNTGAMSLIIHGDKWYLRVNIPALLQYVIDLNMKLERREKLIMAIKKEIFMEAKKNAWIKLKGKSSNKILISPSMTNPISYDGSGDIFYLPIP